AVSTDLLQLAAVAPATSGRRLTLWVGRMKGPPRSSSLRAATLSRPTWDRATGTFWTVADGSKIRSVGLDGKVRAIGLDDRRPGGRVAPWRVQSDGSSIEPSPMPLPGAAGTLAITAAPDVPPVISNTGGTLSINQGTWVSPAGKGDVLGGAPAYPG